MDAEQQFQTAAKLHQSGDLDGAESILADLLEAIPGNPDILHFLSVVRLQSGRAESAVDGLKELTELRPDWPEGFDLLGVALRQSNRLDAAIRQFRKAIDLNPDYAQAHFNLGNVYRDNRQFDEAARHFNKTILIDPDHLDARFNLGQMLFNQGNLSEATVAFENVIERNPADTEAAINLAETLRLRNFPRASLRVLKSTVEFAPEHAEALDFLAEMAIEQGEPETAIICLDKLMAIEGETPALVRQKAIAQQNLGDMDTALVLSQKALELAPEDPQSLLHLAYLYERLNRVDDAWEVLKTGFEADEGHPGLNLIAARLERREKKTDEAIARLSALSKTRLEESTAQSEIYFELGHLYTVKELPGDAMENFSKGNEALNENPDQLTSLMAVTAEYLTRIESAFEDEAHIPDPDSGPDDLETPLFVLGFPRSGTTLLDQVLGAHPGLQVMEEPPTLSQVRDVLSGRDQAFPGNLFQLSDEDLDLARDAYFKAAEAFIEREPGTRLVDKMPLNTINAGIIKQLFPRAKFLLALRHPCDVCLSCFMQAFDLNETMAHFTRMEDTVAFYDRVMTLWHHQREVLDLDVHEVRYEDLVTDLDTVARGIVEFLDLPWNDAVLDPTGYARKQDYIGTSSYHQVVEEVNTRAVDRWRTFEIHLTPYLRRLQPHIDKFGYGNLN